MRGNGIVYLLLVVMLLGACMKDMPDSLNGYTVSKGVKDSGTEPTSESKVLKVSVENLSFSSYAGNQSFGITSNVSWRVSCDADWVTLTESNTRGTGNGMVTVSVKQNSETKSRTATITISSTDAGSVKVSITQAAANSDLQLDKNNLSFTSTGGSDSFTITSNVNWTITSDQIWCTVSTSSGSKNGTITVYVSENNSIDSRSASITVKAGDMSQTIAVTQAGTNVILQVRESSMSFNSSGGSDTFAIYSNTSWTISSNRSWCTVGSLSGSGNVTVTVRVSENTSTDSRTATITVRADNVSQTIAVNQAGATPVDQDIRTFTANGVSFKMIRVDGGTFTMGATSEQGSDADSAESPTHRVTLSTYYIGETEVTQALWQAVMGQKPTNDGSQWNSTDGRGNNYPAYYISWSDCQEFIRKLNTLTGQSFRLPTEAEWEFAARGGNESQGYKYSGSNTLSNVAWYRDNSYALGESSPDYGTHNVATKSPNELGLYDMSGNVWEWCQDWYGSYSSSSQTNPTGPSSGAFRMYRGGDWANHARLCRVSSRSSFWPDRRSPQLGLRLALQ